MPSVGCSTTGVECYQEAKGAGCDYLWIARWTGRQVIRRASAEMAELNAALDDAMAGRGRLIMLAGEPGIGKTRIAQELTSRASELEAQVFWGWCYEREGSHPTGHGSAEHNRPPVGGCQSRPARVRQLPPLRESPGQCGVPLGSRSPAGHLVPLAIRGRGLPDTSTWNKPPV